MNRTLKSIALALTLLSPASVFALSSDGGPARAEHRHGRGGHHFFEVIASHAQELGIAPATLDSMKAAFEAARPDFERLHQNLKQARDSGDEAKITAARTAMHERREALRTKIDGMLTEKQRTAIKELIGKGRHRHEGKPAGAPA
jgi:Spy/CpxP family protein refolding chaperone